MSSITILAKQREYIFAVDTAYSFTIQGKIYRDRNIKIEKIHQVGKDVIFIAGLDPVVTYTKRDIHKFLNKNKHIKITELQKYFRKEYPYEKNPHKDFGVSQIGIAIMSIINGNTILTQMCQGYNNYEIVPSQIKEPEAYLSVAGIKADTFQKKVERYFGESKDINNPETFMKLYRSNYYEGVGGDILVYKFNEDGLNLIYTETLDEKGLKYIDDYPNLHSLISGSYISGSTIQGGVMKATELESVDITSSTFTSQGSYTNHNDSVTIENGHITLHDDRGFNTYLTGNSVASNTLATSAITPLSSNVDAQGNWYFRNMPTVSGIPLATTDHTHSTLDITTSVTNGGINFKYGVQAAGYQWVSNNFQPKSSSDFRLKKNMRSLDELPIELLFMLFKPYQYEFKTDSFGKGIFFGLLAQEIESAFEKFGLNPFDYNLIELTDVRENTDEGMYIRDGKIHRVNYENLHALEIYMIQKIYTEKLDLTNRVAELETKINLILESVGK